jgi:hypothetical protein
VGLKHEVIYRFPDPPVSFFDDTDHSFEIIVVRKLAQTCLHLVELKSVDAESS